MRTHTAKSRLNVYFRVLPRDIPEFAESLSTAYSTDRYANGWGPSIKMLRKRGFTDDEIEAIIRSKHTRWAADSSNKRYGRVTSKDLERYMDESKINWTNEARELIEGY